MDVATADADLEASGPRRAEHAGASGTGCLGRYQLGTQLGRGATGIVYEARDTQSGAIVAIKTLVSLNAENLFRLKHEFRSLANLEHENFVRFGELACEDGQWFFTMERVHGTDFLGHVRGGDERRLRATSCRESQY